MTNYTETHTDRQTDIEITDYRDELIHACGELLNDMLSPSVTHRYRSMALKLMSKSWSLF